MLGETGEGGRIVRDRPNPTRDKDSLPRVSSISPTEPKRVYFTQGLAEDKPPLAA